HSEKWRTAGIRAGWPSGWEWLWFDVRIVPLGMAVMARRKQWIYGALGCVTLMVCTSFSGALNEVGRQAIVFNVRRNLAIGLVDRGHAWLYTDLPSIDDRTVHYSVLPALEVHAPVDAIHFIAY